MKTEAEFHKNANPTLKMSNLDADDIYYLSDKDHNTVSEKDYDDHISNMKEKSNLKTKIQQLNKKF